MFNDKNTIGEKIRRRRETMGYSLAEIGKNDQSLSILPQPGGTESEQPIACLFARDCIRTGRSNALFSG